MTAAMGGLSSGNEYRIQGRREVRSAYRRAIARRFEWALTVGFSFSAAERLEDRVYQHLRQQADVQNRGAYRERYIVDQEHHWLILFRRFTSVRRPEYEKI